jgi:hypothetical protein
MELFCAKASGHATTEKLYGKNVLKIGIELFVNRVYRIFELYF